MACCFFLVGVGLLGWVAYCYSSCEMTRSTCVAQEENEPTRRFLAEAPQGWQRYLTFAQRLQMTATATRTGVDNGKPLVTTRFRTECKQATNSAVRVQFSLEAKTDGEVIGSNPSYTFTLKRRTAERGWILVDLKFGKQAKGRDEDHKSIHDDVRWHVCGCLTLWNLWLPDLIGDADFKITSVRPQIVGGLELVRVDFDYPKRADNYPRPGALRITGGWMLLDAQHDWILREYEVFHMTRERSLIHRRFEFKEGSDRHLLATHSKTNIKGKEKESFDIISEADIQTEERPDLPSREFTLSAFGLPEPKGIVWEDGGSPWYLWFTAVGILCLCAGALLWRRVRRRKLTTA